MLEDYCNTGYAWGCNHVFQVIEPFLVEEFVAANAELLSKARQLAAAVGTDVGSSTKETGRKKTR